MSRPIRHEPPPPLPPEATSLSTPRAQPASVTILVAISADTDALLVRMMMHEACRHKSRQQGMCVGAHDDARGLQAQEQAAGRVRECA